MVMMLLARTFNNRDKLRSPGGRSGGTSGLGASGSSSLLRSGSTKSESWGRGPVLPGLTRPVPHHLDHHIIIITLNDIIIESFIPLSGWRS